ncbi:PD-(D/E)XK nuclease family protein, partial [bacterium]|nr:PD-(D/E)XK nuclease family protein [bacterium]
MLKIYQTCPKKFYYRYVEGVNVPVSATPFEKGKKIHALAHYFLQGVNISRIETALTQEERDVWNTLLDNPFFQKDYYKSEYQLSCKIGDYWVGGR